MAATKEERYEFRVESAAYLQHGDRAMMAQFFIPKSKNRSLAYVDMHGGAWNEGDIADRVTLGEYLAARGIMVATLNFRMGPDGYPTSLQDISYAIRWVKAHSDEFGIDPDKVAVGGASSGDTWRCFRRCGRTILATLQLSFRQARPRSMPQYVPPPCNGQSSIRSRAIVTRID